MIHPIRVKTIREQITDSVRSDILCSRLAAGSRLSEAELSRRFGVSRGPVREALSQLTHEGLLVSKPNCGVSVAPLPTNEIRDLVVPIRRTLETYALKLYFHKLNDSKFHVWEEILLKMELACRNGDEKEVVLQDIAFHQFLISRAEQPDLLAIWQAILVRVRGHFCEVVSQRRHMLGQIADEHRQLLEVFHHNDLPAAIEALSRHIW